MTVLELRDKLNTIMEMFPEAKDNELFTSVWDNEWGKLLFCDNITAPGVIVDINKVEIKKGSQLFFGRLSDGNESKT